MTLQALHALAEGEVHKAAAVGAEAVQRRMGALEDELQAKGRLQTERRLGTSGDAGKRSRRR
jgi:hypothetical protein